MSIKKFFSVLSSFMFLVMPTSFHAVNESRDSCLICLNAVPGEAEDRIETSCHHEFCRECLIDWWEMKKEEAEESGWEFVPQCPMCATYQSLDFYEKARVGECPVCLNNKKLVKTNCGHKFCQDCFEKWTKLNNVCPYCRHKNPVLIWKTRKIKNSSPKREIASNEEKCAVCLVGFNSAELTTTSCGHKFHKKCLDEWLCYAPHHNCPVCRATIGVGGDSNDDNSSVDFAHESAWQNNLYDPVRSEQSVSRRDEDDVSSKDLDTYKMWFFCGLHVLCNIARVRYEVRVPKEVEINSDAPSEIDFFDNYPDLGY